MRFFEINEPYFAIVAAEYEEDCIHFYNLIGIHVARSLVFECNNDNEPTLLSVDGSLF